MCGIFRSRIGIGIGIVVSMGMLPAAIQWNEVISDEYYEKPAPVRSSEFCVGDTAMPNLAELSTRICTNKAMKS